MITNEPIFESRDAADRFCTEVQQSAKLAEAEWGKIIAVFGIINAIGFFIGIPVLGLKVLAEIASTPGASSVVLFAVEHSIIVHVAGAFVGAAILEDKYFDKVFAKRTVHLGHLDSVPALKKPIGLYSLQAINQLIKDTIHAGVPFFRANVSSDGKLQFMAKSRYTFGWLLVVSGIIGFVLYGILQVEKW